VLLVEKRFSCTLPLLLALAANRKVAGTKKIKIPIPSLDFISPRVMVGRFETGSGEDLKRELPSVLIRETDLAAVSKYGSGYQVGFTDVAYVARCSSEFASATRDLDGIVVDREQGFRKWSGCRNRRGEGDHVSRLRHPVMLDMKDQFVANLPRRFRQCSTYGASQVSSGDAHRGVGVDGAEVGHEHSAHGNAMAIVVS